MEESRVRVELEALLAGLSVPALVLSEKSLVSSNPAARALLEPLGERAAERLETSDLLSRAFRGGAVASLRRLLAEALRERSGATLVARDDLIRRPGSARAAQTAARVSRWRVDAIPMHSADGTPLALLQLSPAEGEIEAPEDRELERVFEVAQDMLCVLDERGCFLRANRAWRDSLGWTLDELREHDLAELIHPDDFAVCRDESERCFAAGRPIVGLVNRCRHRDGGWRWLLWRATRIEESGLVVACVRDVTEKRFVAEALRASEERFRAAAEGGLDPFLILEAVRDASGVIEAFRLVDLNRRAENFLGASRSTLLGESLEALLDFEEPDQFRARCADVVETRVPFEAELGPGGNETRSGWMKIQVVALADGIALTCRDISDRRRLEEELRQSHKMEALGRLAGGVAHDFNNLLTVINGYSDLLLEEEALAACSLREEAKEIRQAGERAAMLTRQLLAFGRQQVLSPSRLDLAEVVTTMQRMLRRLIGEDIELRTEIEAGVGCVMADRGQMEQILVNLAVNARDAMPEGGCLRLGLCEVDAERVGAPGESKATRRGERLVRLSVSDSGCGMDDSTRVRIFEPFFTTKPRGRGTGLGLSTVHGIVIQSGGQIAVESRPGRGASFYVYLPRSEGAASERPTLERCEDENRGSGTVLLVEDEPQIRTLGQRVLEAAGFRVLLAENGVDALALLRSEPNPIDVLVTDVVMPEMSGPKLVQQLRPLLPGLKVLFVSGYSRSELPHAPQGVDVDFLAKPFRPGEVVRRVRELLKAGDPAPSLVTQD